MASLLRWKRRSATMLTVANNSSEEKPLQVTPFVVHATRGVIRQQRMRRKTMIALLFLALVLLVSGTTFLAPVLNPHEHWLTALIFWIACVWFTITAFLLAIFDLTAVGRAGRREQRELQQRHSAETPLRPDSGNTRVE